jgi:hypothetical protein
MHPQQPPKKRRIWPWIFGAVLVLVASIVVGALARQPSASPAPPSPPTSGVTPAPPPAPSASSMPTVAKVGSWTMPNLVGTNLQDAQDAIQALTGNAIFFTKSHDATGAGRHQILDRDWKVCSQNVPPGTKITADTAIDFGAAKLDERC